MSLFLFFKNWMLVLVIAFCGVNTFFCTQNPQAKTHIVEIKKMKFIPEELVLNKGDTVVWINRDFFPHDVTELKNKSWSSAIIERNKSWARVITKNENYYCSLHVVMKGSLIVK